MKLKEIICEFELSFRFLHIGDSSMLFFMFIDLFLFWNGENKVSCTSNIIMKITFQMYVLGKKPSNVRKKP